MSDLLHDITKAAGRNKRAQRLGRGEGSKGKTSGRGQKGAGSRAGKSKRIGFEGGQTEIYRRFPLRGFSNKPFETKFHVVNLSDLARFDAGSTVDQRALKEAGLIPNLHQNVKILGHGSLDRKLTVVAAAYSRSAHQAILAAGGVAQDVAGQPFQFREPKNRRQAAKLDKRLARLGLPPREQGNESAEDAGNSAGRKKSGKGGRADVTEAPESGTKDSGGTPRGKPAAATPEAPNQAPESGDQE